MKISYNLKNWYGPNHINALGVFMFTIIFLAIAALTCVEGLQFMSTRLQAGASDIPVYSAVMFMISLFFIWLSVHNLSCLAMMRWRVRYDGMVARQDLHDARMDLLEANLSRGGFGMYESMSRVDESRMAVEVAKEYLKKFEKSDIWNRWK